MPGVLPAKLAQTINEMVESAMAAGGPSALTCFSDVVDMLKKENLCILAKDLEPGVFWVHPKNRAGLGLNPYQAHRTGARILSVGASKAQLQNAFAFELQPDGPQREAQVIFNTRLVSRSKGLLAGPTGQERYLTVGCGHTVGFCKAAKAGCVTKQESLQDEAGAIDKQKLFKDKVFEAMVMQGWDWWIISHAVDKACPKFAHVAQKALNASNHVASLCSELEAAQMLSQHVDTADSDDELDAALAEVQDVCAPCASYADCLLKFVNKFAGGPGAPHIQFIDNVVKQFGCTASLGEGGFA